MQEKNVYTPPEMSVVMFAMERGFAGSELNYKTNVVTGQDTQDKMVIKNDWDATSGNLDGEKFWSN